MAQYGEDVESLVKLIIHGIFVGHHDRTRALLYITKSGLCEVKVGQDRS